MLLNYGDCVEDAHKTLRVQLYKRRGPVVCACTNGTVLYSRLRQPLLLSREPSGYACGYIGINKGEETLVVSVCYIYRVYFAPISSILTCPIIFYKQLQELKEVGDDEIGLNLYTPTRVMSLSPPLIYSGTSEQRTL